jgi:hypothetical protein
MAERRDRSRRLLVPVEQAAAEAGGYAVDAPELDRLLSRIEERAAGALDRLLGGAFPPTGEDRASLTLLVGLQLVVGRGHRERSARAAEILAEVIGQRLPESEDAEASAEAPAESPAGLTAVPHLARLLSLRTWQLVRFPGPLLLTSDTPAALWTRPGSPTARRWGLGGADEVRVPLDPRHALIIARHAPAGEVVRDLEERHARALNRTIAEAAHAWMYYHPGSDPLERVELEPA